MNGRDYFPGCADVPLFDDERGTCQYCGKPLAYIGADQDSSPDAMQAKCWGRFVDHAPATDAPTLADAVAAAEARRDPLHGQLELPAEFLPIPTGAMFA